MKLETDQTKDKTNDLSELPESENNQTETEKTDLPDGGWAWLVVFGSFMSNVVLDGISFSFGILLIPLIKNFNSTRSVISNGGSLMNAVEGISGPIAGALINKIGARKTCLLGCLISAIGFALSSYSVNVPMLMITFGVMGGYGFGHMYVTSLVVISDYFDKKRGLATGIADAGSGIGILVFAPLTAILVENYDWKGTHLSFAIFCVAAMGFAALMGPICKNINKKQGNIECSKNALNKLNNNSDESKISLWRRVSNAMNFSLLKNPFLLFVGSTNLLGALALFIPYFFLPDFVVEKKNYTEEDASWLISAMGIANTLGRIFLYGISDLAWINSLWTCASAILMTSGALFATPFCSTYTEFLIAASVFGFFSAALQMNPVIMVELLGLKNLSLGLSYVTMFRGIGVLIGPPIAGAVFDATNSYDIPFYLAGGFMTASCLLLALAAILHKFKNQIVGKQSQDNLVDC